MSNNGANAKPKVAFGLLVVIALTGLWQANDSDWRNWLVNGNGKSWKNTVEECQEERSCEVEVWPGGDSCRFTL